MKKFLVSVSALLTLMLAGCFETTQEITLKEDGSGVVSNTNDLSALIGVAKNMGGGADLEKELDQAIDSTVSMKEGADSITNLTPEERGMVRKGTLHFNINLKAEKFVTDLSFPFSKPSEVAVYNKLSGKIMAEVLKDKMADGSSMGGDQMPEASSMDDYYTLEFSNGELTKKINKEKYAAVGNDEYLKSMKEAAGMGMNMKANYVINLPRPATKAEGKNVTLSADKKKVTISADIEDFFDDPAALEFKIKY